MTPVLASRAADGPLWLESAATKLEHLRAHLMIEFSPSEQIKAHKRTDSTITTFASKVLLSLGSDGSWLDEGGRDARGGELYKGLWSSSLLEWKLSNNS